MKRSRFLAATGLGLFSVALAATGCKPRTFNASVRNAGDAGTRAFTRLQAPDDAVLTLLPPENAAARRADGSVEAIVLYAPAKLMAEGVREGQRLRVRWDMNPDFAWRVVKPEAIAIPADRKANFLKGKKDVLPFAIDGWEKVTPLESLAAARAKNPDGLASPTSPSTCASPAPPRVSNRRPGPSS